MTMKRGILCEVIFKDAKTGTPTNLIGRIDEYQLEKFNTNINDFISFVKSCHPPVFKDDIKKITVYNDEDGTLYYVEQGKLEIYRSDSDMRKAKVS